MKRISVSAVLVLFVVSMALGATPGDTSPPDTQEQLLNALRASIGDSSSSKTASLQSGTGDSQQTEGTTASSAAQAAWPNPYGCYGKTDNPHVSGTTSDQIAVKARTFCPNGPAMPTIGVDTILMKGSLCIGNTCLSWSPYSTLDTNEAHYVTSVRSRASGSPCEDGVYRGDSLHYIIDSEDDLYYAFTKNAQQITSCD